MINQLLECASFVDHGRGGSWPPASLSWDGAHLEAGSTKASRSFPSGGVASLGNQGEGGYDSWQLVGDWPLPSITTTAPSPVSHL